MIPDILKRASSLSIGGSSEMTLQGLLEIVRKHLNMDVAFVSHFLDGERVFLNVDTRSDASSIKPGDADLMEDSYCARIADGRLPEFIPDTSLIEQTREMPVTGDLCIASYMGVPITLSTGEVFGTFCCFSHDVDTEIQEKDLSLLKTFADVASSIIEPKLQRRRDLSVVRERINRVISDDALTIVYQPVYRLHDNRLAGWEALSRFAGEPKRPPNEWFDDAAKVGLGKELEFAALRKAASAMSEFRSYLGLSINLSPSSILSPEFAEHMEGLRLNRLAIEVTEHEAVENYSELIEALAPFRKKGLWLAVDDAGAGHSSFRHVLDLKPDVIKLDMSITRNVDSDPGRFALAKAFTAFARSIGSEVLAEGIETEQELNALREVGISKVQGYLVGRPVPWAEACEGQGVIPPVLQQARQALAG